MTFFTEALADARFCAGSTRLFTSVILAQWADETGYRWPPPGNNPGNISPGGSVATYGNLTLGLAAYCYTMNSQPQFGPRIRQGTTPQAQCYLLGSASPVWAASHYGSPPGSTLVQIIAENDLTQYDTPLPEPTGDDMKYGIVNVGPGLPTWLVTGAGKLEIPTPSDITAWRNLGAVDVVMSAAQVALLPTL